MGVGSLRSRARYAAAQPEDFLDSPLAGHSAKHEAVLFSAPAASDLQAPGHTPTSPSSAMRPIGLCRLTRMG